MSTQVEVRATLKCSVCKHPFECSARYARAIRRGVYPQKCRPCARGARRKPYEELSSTQAQTRAPVTDRERRWCLEHYTDEEIVQIAWAMSGEPGDIAVVREWRALLGVLAPTAVAAA